MKKFLATAAAFFTLTCSNFAACEIRTYEGVGEYIMSDFETPDMAKQRAKERAEKAAQEMAGVFVKSNVKVVNKQLQSEEIEVLTAGVMQIKAVDYETFLGEGGGLLIRAKVTADIDTNKIDEKLAMNESERNALIEQNRALRDSVAERERQLAELKEKLAAAERDNSVATSPLIHMQLTNAFNQAGNAFLSTQRFKAGNEAYTRGDYNGAIIAYTEAIEFDNSNAAAYLYRGSAFGTLGDYMKSAADYTNAIRLDGNNANAYVGRGIAYYYMGNYAAAVADLTAAIQADPQNAKAYYTRSVCYSALYRGYEAREDYETAYRLGWRN